MNGLFTFLFGVLLIPMTVNAANTNFEFKFLNEESCEETAERFFTDGDSYTALNIFNTTCLGNATTPTDGQFTSTIEIVGEANTTWYIDDAIGYYDPAFPAPAVPTAYPTGLMGVNFSENPTANPDTSLYKLEVLTIHGQANLIRMRSSKDDIVTLTGQSPKYESSIIEGPISLCTDAIATYSSNTFPGPYDWTISGGGMFSLDTDTKSTEVTVEWGGVQGTYLLTFTASGDPCVAPTILEVTLGDFVPNSIACESSINVSLPGDCDLEITPNHLLIGDPADGAPYAVMLTDEHDNVIPNATLTYAHVGQRVKAKLLDGCSNNSCWTWINVEDKLPPQIVCEDVTIACHKLDEYDGPLAFDNCDIPVEVTLVNELTEMQDCDPDYGWIVRQTYIATDESGNESEPCEVTIYVERVELDSIKFPENLLTVDMTNLICNDYDLDEDGFPDPAITGVPTLGGEPIWPEANSFCQLYATYDDVLRKPNDCTKKVMRTWRVYEWYCGGVVDSTYTQVIEINDNVAPQVTCGADITVSATFGECEATVALPPVEATDDCSETFEVDVAYPGGFLDNQNGGVVNLPFGVHEIKYYVYDECGNLDSCNLNVTVIDKTPPVAVCDQNSVVGLDIYGDAYAPASIFDDGSYDACKIDFMEVRRMDLGAPCGDPIEDFGPYVEFCCEDAGKVVVVEFRVWDKAGNSNTCMVNVEVQDKFPPRLTAPGDETINCDVDFDLDDLSEYGLPIVEDACGAVLSDTAYAEIDQCNVGKITRIFTATDANGFSVDTQCIFIINPDPFNDDGMDITWPLDLDTSAVCGNGMLDPENLPDLYDFPDLEEDFCDLVSATHYDELYPFDDPDGNACYKIIRRWTVIDWCQEIDYGRPPQDGEPRFATWIHDQVIKLRNFVPPTIDGSLDDIEVCSQDCDGGLVTLTQTGSDDCTSLQNLQWEWEIDYDMDGTVDTMDTGYGPNMDASDFHPIGFHSILWTYEDRCGNRVSLQQLFRVIDCNGPKAVAIDGFSVGLTGMDLDGDGTLDDEIACMWANEFDGSSYHPCDVPITFSFSTDTTDTELCFNCFDLGTNLVWIYVTDIFGNVDSVQVEVDVQDNNDVDICMDPRDCVTFPVDTTIEDCVIDLDPVTLNSMPFIDPDCSCDNYDITFQDDTLNTYPDASCLYLRRTWQVVFNCGRNPIVAAEDQEIVVLNLLPPDISCPDDVTVAATGPDCMADVMLDLASSAGSCNSGVVITNSYNGGGADASGMYPVGETIVIFTVEDGCGNMNTCSTTVTVTDGELPTCVPQDITITLDENGDATITAADVDGGSSDACGMIASTTVSEMDFDCGDIGMNTVTLTVTDDSGNSSECDATVTVRDTIAPICITQDITITVDDSGDTEITVDQIDNGSNDPCGMIVSRTLDRTTFNCSDTGTDVVVTLTIVDDSGNVSTCEATVTVEDNTPPQCMVQNITISIDMGNMVTIVPGDLDIGSSDACGMIIDTTLSQSVFTCDDLGENMVTYTVTDNSGNTAECTATVTVEDMTEPVCSAEDITIYVDETGNVSITPEDIDNGSSAGCNEMFTLSLDRMDFTCADISTSPVLVILTVTDQDMNETMCAANVTVLDTIPPTIMCENLTLFCYEFDGDFSRVGGLTFSDNCMGSVTDIDTMILVDGTNVCGIGTVTRRFTVTDAEGNMATCDQIIDIVGEEDPFDEMDITFPTSPLLVEDCTADISPMALMSETTVDTSLDSCSMVTIEFVDNIISSGGFCGDTIERKWTVVDSCQFDGVSGAGMWMFTQTIVVVDTFAPMLQGPPDFTVSAPDSGQDCEVFVDLSMVIVSDDCDDNVMVTNDSPFAFDNDIGDASGNYVPGIYVITLTATDVCGNETPYTFTLTVEEPELAGLPCIKVFASILDGGTITVTPADFGVTQMTDCYDPTGLVFSFDRVDMNVGSATFDCDDVGVTDDPSGLGIMTPLYAFENGILVDSCINIVTVIDPFGNCTNGVTAEIEGKVFTTYEERIEGVEIYVSGDYEEKLVTDVNGEYAFPAFDYGTSITVEPYKNDDVLNGVSTLDLIYIQRHILGLDVIEDTHMMVAADINNSKTISISDVLELRRVLLGVNNEFPDNTSWRMIDSKYSFPEVDNPFAEELPGVYQINALDRRMHVDFIGVKVGDVDGTAKANARSLGQPRSAFEEFTLNRVHDNGITSLRPEVTEQVFGLQMVVQLDNGVDQINSDLPGFSKDHYYIDDNNTLYISWSVDESVTLSDDMNIISLRSNVEGVSENILLYPEVYVDAGEEEIVIKDLTIDQLELRPMTSVSTQPNPWVEFTDLRFEISYSDRVTVKLYDSNGRIVELRQIDAVKGLNNVRFTAEELDASGVIFYDIISSREKAQGKMILIK
ncbi:MAG: HYR domain-containing protein [Saprospiraceae bacterium]|nr:HYR domain-containing protein [Saprospiraceae bacterium]